MNLDRLALVALASLAVAGCMAPVGPVEVTRFHAPDAARLGQGTVRLEPAPGMNGEDLEFRSYAAAVERELLRVGYGAQVAGSGMTDQIAQVSLTRRSLAAGREGGPVSVGMGAGTGSYGSGVGVGVGINLSGPPPEQVTTELFVMIRDRASDKSLWEGRARFTVRASSARRNWPRRCSRAFPAARAKLSSSNDRDPFRVRFGQYRGSRRGRQRSPPRDPQGPPV